jgi:small subunit ribosomal protein S8
MKNKGHIDFKVDEENKTVDVKIIKLNECRAIKPRYFVGVGDIDKYLRRFLPSRNFGTLVVSTNKGMLDQKESVKENVGGSIIAYFY